jgi:hypothetical protein
MRLFWDSVRNSKDAADFNAYLARFPQGAFVELARNRLAQLHAAPIADDLSAKMLAALAFSRPQLTQPQRENVVSRYQPAKEHRAVALSLVNGRSWVSGTRPTAQVAEEASLEACEIIAGGPCVLLAVDDSVKITSVNDLVPRSMPRVHYAGAFDPAQIPNVMQEVRERADVAGYAKAALPKAAAFQPGSGIVIVTGAANQRAAEEQALAACNADPKSTSNNGTCYLYASGQQVVYEHRSTAAITAVAPAPNPPVQPPSTPPAVAVAPPVSFRDDFVKQIAAALPALPVTTRETLATSYVGYAQHKALALHLKNGGTWRSMGHPSAELAETSALEGCEAFFGDPCVLFALDQTLHGGSEGALPPRDMPRNAYAGTFDPAKIPGVVAAVTTRADVQGYAAATGAKAAALHPWGSLYVSTGAANLRQAETDALAACNGDKQRGGQGGPCYLYASGNQVVFPKRLQQPMTAAAPVAAVVPNGPVALPAWAGGAVKPPPPAPAPADATTTALLALLALLPANEAGPGLTRAGVESSVRGYALIKDHKAMVISLSDPTRPSGIYTGSAESAQDAQNLTLEGCQVASGTPCALAAIDNSVAAPPAAGKWNPQDMPRVRYEGSYEPGMIPGLSSAQAKRNDVANYARAPGPKAMAVGNRKVAAVTGAASQAAAEQQALAGCGDGCYLYAAGNQVVLPQRLRNSRPLGNTLAAVISYTAIDDSGAKRAADYGKLTAHKSLAILPESGYTFSYDDTATAAGAERLALEACGLVRNARCVTVAVEDKLQTTEPTRAARPAMPRLDYQGPFRADMVPLYLEPPKEAHEYARMREPKAMAIRPLGPKVVVESAATLAEAEAKALAKCADPDSPFPCFIYAANNQVILPQRRTEPQP